LDVINCQLANMMKKEGRAPAKPQPQLQPEYVKKAKTEAETSRKEAAHMSTEDYDEMKAFWQAYNCGVKGAKNDN